MRKIINFFDKLEDQVRLSLSHYPFIYSILGGLGVVLFWRGVWHAADIFEAHSSWGQYVFSPVGSMLLGVLILLVTGLLVSSFIGEKVIITDIQEDTKMLKKSIKEIEEDLQIEKNEHEVLRKIEEELSEINR